MSNTRPLVYIHGNNSTPRVWNFLMATSNMRGRWNQHCVEYDTRRPVMECVSDVHDQIYKQYGEREIDIIAHSLGGLISLCLMETDINVRRIVTLASPLNGIRILNFASIVSRDPIWHDLAPRSKFMKYLRSIDIDIPVLSIIATVGSWPLLMEPNDGVVTIRSQENFPGCSQLVVELNHYEGLLDYSIATTMMDFLNKG